MHHDQSCRDERRGVASTNRGEERDSVYPLACLVREHPVKGSLLLVLNCPISSAYALESVWRSAAYRMCVDGGANRLHDLLDQQPSRREQHVSLASRISDEVESSLTD